MFGPSTIATVTIEDVRDQDEDEIHFHAGGQGFWIARLLGRLGVPTTLCTTIGGESGRVVEALIGAEPIDIRAVKRHGPNGAWVHDRRDGERNVIADTAGPALGRHDTDELISAALAAGLLSGVCVLAGPHRSGLLDAAQYTRLASDLRSNGVTVIADLSGEPLLAALEGGVDFCKVSDEDLANTAGVDATDPLDALRWLTSHGARHAAVTRGADPLLAAIGGDAVEVGGPQLHVVDHRGAGDAFTALIAAGCYWGLGWSEALRWGAAAGTLSIIRRGLATADRREIHQLLPQIELRPLID